MANTSKTRGSAAAGLAIYGMGIGWYPTNEPDAGMGTLLADFLADLMFSCDEVGQDFNAALERARRFYFDADEEYEGSIKESHQESLDLIERIARDAAP